MRYIIHILILQFFCYGSEHPVKDLIYPYIEEEFYYKSYAKQLEETGLSPVDHYLEYGWQGDWESNTDPAAWFSTIIYKQLWGSHKNPLADWLIQPSSIAKETDPVVGVFCKQEEVPRAWLAIEDFLREKKKPVQVALLLQEGEFSEVPVCFKPQQARGLQIYKYSGREFSFYESSFLKFPLSYKDITDLTPIESIEACRIVKCALNFTSVNNQVVLIHNAVNYRFFDYFKDGILNPRVCNFIALDGEPLWSRKTEHQYVKKIFRQADLIFSSERETGKHVLIPGYLKLWISAEEVEKKDFSISFLLSLGKRSASSVRSMKSLNYKERLTLWENREDILQEKKFYVSSNAVTFQSIRDGSSNLLPTNSRVHLMKSQFNIAIENCCQENYFTEKILDCFIAMVVPIYMGCSNITEFFNPKGMIIVNSVDEIIAACNALTSTTYQEMLPHLQENHEKAKEFLTLRKRKMEEFIQEKMYPSYEGLSLVTKELQKKCSYTPMLTHRAIQALIRQDILKE